MNHILEYTRPVIFGHRGACAHAPENTLAAFELAAEHGADAVELDAKLSLDGEIVVIHDPTVDRTSSGSGKVRQMTLAQLRALDVGSKFSPQFVGQRIPTLAEVFESVGRKVIVNIELTNYAAPGDGLTERVVELVKRFQLEDWVCFSSFHPLNISRARALLPQVPGGILAMRGGLGALSRGWLGRLASPQMVHPYFTDVTAASAAAEHARQRRVNVWTVNAPEEMRRMFQAGVDGLITDDPRLARQVLEQM